MKELKQLTAEELRSLYPQVIELREKVLEFVQRYNYDASSLVSRQFEHDIEMWFGKRTLEIET
jgi:hypothetical protein